MSDVYQPAEDSFLIGDVVKRFLSVKKPRRVLDMGSGTGYLAEICVKNGVNQEDLVLVDKNKDAIKILKNKFPRAEVLESDLFSKVRGKFDLIIFNPPYLPKDEREPESSRLATTGGDRGSEVLNKFLKDSVNFLESNGKIFVLTSNLTEEVDFRDYKKRIIERKKIFMEELFVWELSL